MEYITVDTDGPICLVTLNRPEVRNAVHRPMADELAATVAAFEADEALRVLVLTGAGGTFCAGADLGSMQDPDLRNDVSPVGDGPGPMGPTRLRVGKPLIAAIEGYAVAGGLELAIMADLRVAAEDAVLGVFCRRFGVPLIDGGTARLPRIVGLGRALDLILTGRAVPATEALAMGLVTSLTAPGAALAGALDLARTIASFPQECMITDRASTYAGMDLSLEEAIRSEGVAGGPIVEREGIAGARRFADGAGRHGAFSTEASAAGTTAAGEPITVTPPAD